MYLPQSLLGRNQKSDIDDIDLSDYYRNPDTNVDDNNNNNDNNKNDGEKKMNANELSSSRCYTKKIFTNNIITCLSSYGCTIIWLYIITC